MDWGEQPCPRFCVYIQNQGNKYCTCGSLVSISVSRFSLLIMCWQRLILCFYSIFNIIPANHPQLISHAECSGTRSVKAIEKA